jgi:phosphoribosylformimino-5-aminoimidazole carboxamide ribonucleotide (ProFAR) isomerase
MNNTMHSGLAIGGLLSAGEKITIIGCYDSEKINEVRQLVREHNRNCTIEIDYKSVFGEKWRMRGFANAPTRMDD